VPCPADNLQGSVRSELLSLWKDEDRMKSRPSWFDADKLSTGEAHHERQVISGTRRKGHKSICKTPPTKAAVSKLGTVLRQAAAAKRLTLQNVIGQAPLLAQRAQVASPQSLISSVAWRWVARDENNQQGQPATRRTAPCVHCLIRASGLFISSGT
jgi:hypothetical protein